MKNFNNKINLVCFCGICVIAFSLFIIDMTYGSNNFGFDHIFTTNNYHDYFADFFNQVRITYDNNVYDGISNEELAQKALPPFQYVLLSVFGKIFDYNQVPTLFLNGFALTPDLSKPIFLSTYFMSSIAILFFICLYENLNLNNKYLKILVALSLIYSCPLISTFQRGNLVLVAALLVSIFIFYYKSKNENIRFLSLLSLSFAISLKPIPILFLALLIYEKRFKDILKVLLMSFTITILSFIILHGGLAGIFDIPLYIRNAIIHQKIHQYATNNLTILFLVLYCIGFLYKTEWKRVFIVFLLSLTSSCLNYNCLFLFPVIILFLNQQDFHKKDIIYTILLILFIIPIRLINNFYICYLSGLILIINLIYENKKYFINKIKTITKL